MNIFISGIGGLGLIGLSKRMCGMLETLYPSVLSSENRGIAQRRGHISATLRAGSSTHTPRLVNGKVDLLIALEALEALKHPELIGPNTLCIVSDLKMKNFGGNQTKHGYPPMEQIVQRLNQLGAQVIVVEYEQFMLDNQLLKVHISSAILGVFSRLFKFTEDELQQLYPKLFKDARNNAALNWGYQLFDFNQEQQCQVHPIAA